jgi:hypothetical protein
MIRFWYKHGFNQNLPLFLAHILDEHIGEKEFFKGVEFMYRLMKALSAEAKQ